MTLDEAGWVHPALHRDTPNRDARPPGAQIELIVIHAISVAPGRFGAADVERMFMNRLDPEGHPAFAALASLRVSSHFLIDRAGELWQFVSCLDRAWHAGRSRWHDRSACNDFSLGIELIGSEFEPFTSSQYRRLDDLVGLLARSFPIVECRGHDEIAPGRKFDPGPYFDWSNVARDTQGGEQDR